MSTQCIVRSPIHTLGSRIFLVTLAVAMLFSSGAFHQRQAKAQSADDARVRTIVTTDGEVDDFNSFIRFLLYTNEFDVEGLVYSSSQWHYAGDGRGTLFTSELEWTQRYGERTDLRWTGTDWMQEFIRLYSQAYPTLLEHDKNYPSPEHLLSLVKVGNINFEGDMAQPTEGSEWIKQVLLDDDPRPVYVQVWGGTNTFARALKSIEEEYKGTDNWEDIYRKVSDKAIIFTILDQDMTYRNYIEPNWPDIKVYYDSAQFWAFAYAWPRAVPEDMQVYLNGAWFAENIKFNHGPLLGKYYTWGDGQRTTGDTENTRWNLQNALDEGRAQYDFISEGDSPAFLHLIDVGLRNIEDPSYGGWGGRLVQSPDHPNRWEDGELATDFNPYTGEQDTAYPLVRWIPAIQNDFAARADWAVMGYDAANHPPVVTLNGEADMTAKPGETVELSGAATDPDGDDMIFTWWQYEDVDTYEGRVEIVDAEAADASFVVPDDAQSGDTIHIIFEVTDSGTPPLTRYQRVIVTVE